MIQVLTYVIGDIKKYDKNKIKLKIWQKIKLN